MRRPAHVGQLHIGVVPADAGDDLPPQLADLQHVAFVHAAQAPAPLLGALECDPRDAFHLRRRRLASTLRDCCRWLSRLSSLPEKSSLASAPLALAPGHPETWHTALARIAPTLSAWMCMQVGPDASRHELLSRSAQLRTVRCYMFRP